MLTICSLLSLPILLPAFFITHVVAASGGVIAEDSGPRPELAAALTGGEGCSATNIEDIRSGFVEMTELYKTATPYDGNGQPATEFFGSPLRIANFSDMIESNLRRASIYANLKGSTIKNPDVHIRCDDPQKICGRGSERDGYHAAYNMGNAPMVNFCPTYFKLEGLQDRIKKKADSQMEKERLAEYYNRGTVWARMIMHFAEVGTAVIDRAVPAGANSTKEWTLVRSNGPMNTSVLAGVWNDRPDSNTPTDVQTLKFAYGVTRAKLLAVLTTQEPYDAANNAENYALYAQARYILDRKGFYPKLPVMDFSNQLSVLTNEQLQDGERNKFAFFDTTDVTKLPSDMQLEGRPLPGVASSIHASPLGLGLTIAAMVVSGVWSSFG